MYSPDTGSQSHHTRNRVCDPRARPLPNGNTTPTLPASTGSPPPSCPMPPPAPPTACSPRRQSGQRHCSSSSGSALEHWQPYAPPAIPAVRTTSHSITAHSVTGAPAAYSQTGSLSGGPEMRSPKQRQSIRQRHLRQHHRQCLSQRVQGQQALPRCAAGATWQQTAPAQHAPQAQAAAGRADPFTSQCSCSCQEQEKRGAPAAGERE